MLTVKLGEVDVERAHCHPIARARDAHTDGCCVWHEATEQSNTLPSFSFKCIPCVARCFIKLGTFSLCTVWFLTLVPPSRCWNPFE